MTKINEFPSLMPYFLKDKFVQAAILYPKMVKNSLPVMNELLHLSFIKLSIEKIF